MYSYIFRTVIMGVATAASLYMVYGVARTFLSVDGDYSNWSPFGECTKTCGNGRRVRFRTCTNPSPRFDGYDCSTLGEATEVLPCTNPPCAVHGDYSEWRKWSDCSVKCGGGETWRTRKCSNPFPKYGGKSCIERGLGPERESKPCNEDIPCRVNGGYGDWSEFSSCSVTCGGGIQQKLRKCDSPAPTFNGKGCESLGPSVETSACNTEPCP